MLFFSAIREQGVVVQQRSLKIMLQRIHERLKGWIAWFIIIVICFTLAFFGIETYFSAKGASKNVAATVNGHAITEELWQRVYEQMQQQNARNTPPQEQSAQSTFLKKAALEQLITTQVLATNAAKEGFYIAPSQLEQVIFNEPSFQEQGEFSPTKLQRLLTLSHMSVQDFTQALQQQLISAQLRSAIVNTSFIFPEEVTAALNLVFQQRSFRYLLLPLSLFKPTQVPEEETLKAYYNKHKNVFLVPEQVKLAYLQLNLKDLVARQVISETELKGFYEKNQNSFTIPEKWQVAHILLKLPNTAKQEEEKAVQDKSMEIYNKLKKGQSFPALAKEYSEDVTTANKGGLLPWLGAGLIDDSYVQNVKKLKEGGFSEPFRSRYGFVIIKLISRKAPSVLSLEQAKPQITQTLAQEKAQKDWSDLNDKLANLTYTNPDNLDLAAKELKLPIQTTEFFSKQGGDSAFTKNNEIIRTAFGSDQLIDGNNSDVIPLNNESAVVIRVIDQKPRRILTFDDAKPKLIELLQQEQAIKQAKLAADKFLTMLTASASSSTKDIANINEFLNEYKLKWQTINNVDRNAADIPPAVLAAAFRLSHPLAEKPLPLISVPLSKGQGYAIVQLQQVVPGQAKKITPEQYQTLTKSFADLIGNSQFDAYLKAAITTAKIERNKEVSINTSRATGPEGDNE